MMTNPNQGIRNRDEKLALLLEGQREGVREVCARFGISRTLYYRWLSRYREGGIDGLDVIKRRVEPPNKTDVSIRTAMLNLVKQQPHFGPRALKYLLDDLGMKISESAVYNLLKREGLSLRDQRVRYARQRLGVTARHHAHANLPAFGDLKSGEGWLFWTVAVGHTRSAGPLYVYTFMDVVSRIACSRIYANLHLDHFENLLTAVAMPVAQSLKLDIKHLYLTKEDRLFAKKRDASWAAIDKILHVGGFDVALGEAHSEDMPQIKALKIGYNSLCLGSLMPLLKSGEGQEAIKGHLQQWVRDYNLNHMSLYEGGLDTPVNYHGKKMETDLILPLWAYLERSY